MVERCVVEFKFCLLESLESVQYRYGCRCDFKYPSRPKILRGHHGDHAGLRMYSGITS
jgi:hypothetical protein